MPPPSANDILIQQKEQLHKTSVSATVTNKSRGLRATTAVPAEESLMGSGLNSTNLFTRVGTVEGSPARNQDKTFRTSAYKGIRSAAFKNL